MDFPILQILIFITFLVSLINFKQSSPRYLKYFSIFLFITLLVEIIGLILRLEKQPGYNRLLYNIFIPLEFIFLFLFYVAVINDKKIKLPVYIIAGAYFVTCIVSIYAASGLYTFNTFNLVCGGSILLVLLVYYYFDLIRNIETASITQEPTFWISTGLFFFYLVDIPLFSMLNYLNKNYPDLLKTLSVTNKVLNYSMYSLFLLGYFIRWKKSK